MQGTGVSWLMPFCALFEGRFAEKRHETGSGDKARNKARTWQMFLEHFD